MRSPLRWLRWLRWLQWLRRLRWLLLLLLLMVLRRRRQSLLRLQLYRRLVLQLGMLILVAALGWRAMHSKLL